MGFLMMRHTAKIFLNTLRKYCPVCDGPKSFQRNNTPPVGNNIGHRCKMDIDSDQHINTADYQIQNTMTSDRIFIEMSSNIWLQQISIL